LGLEAEVFPALPPSQEAFQYSDPTLDSNSGQEAHDQPDCGY
jgi:hypothetical protein